jgi:uncharacterized protein (DUF924 family)
MVMSADPRKVLDFWFSADTRPLWFRSTPEFDARLCEDFLDVWQAAARGELEHWGRTPEGALALVIVLDQFPLNMFRGEAESFSTEALSRRVAREAIDRGWDRDLDDAGKAFLYLPFMHSEALEDQDRSVQLFRDAGLVDNLRWAEHHREIIRRFGRFPHRNVALGRASTHEEKEWLQSSGAFQG